LLADVLFHPEAGPTGSTAQSPSPVAAHLHHLDIAGGGSHFAGSEVDVVVATQVAGVVVGDLSTRPATAAGVEPPLAQELGEELGVVDHLVLASELGVLVGQG